MLAQMGITAGSKEALLLVPFMTLLTAVWFLVLYLLKAGRIVKYVSTPVMGGFISGVGLTIILMQFSKLFGGDPGLPVTVIMMVLGALLQIFFRLDSFGVKLMAEVIPRLCDQRRPAALCIKRTQCFL